MKFGAKVALLSFATVATAMAFIAFVPRGEDDFNASGMRAKRAAMNNATSPKVVFVAGSSGAFGIDSPTIQAALGRPVVNMALNAPVGLEYMLNEVRPSVNAGDLIVIAPEYHLLFPELMDEWQPPTKFYPWIVFDAQPASVRFFPPQKLLEALTVGPGQIARLVGERVGELVRANHGPKPAAYTFNANGDFVGHLGKKADAVEEYDLLERGYRPPNADIVRAINDFTAFAQARGARVVLVYPPLLDDYFDRNAAAIRQLDADLRRELRAPILASPEDFRFPRAYFYDTVYHLNDVGREARAQKLISLIRSQ